MIIHDAEDFRPLHSEHVAIELKLDCRIVYLSYHPVVEIKYLVFADHQQIRFCVAPASFRPLIGERLALGLEADSENVLRGELKRLASSQLDLRQSVASPILGGKHGRAVGQFDLQSDFPGFSFVPCGRFLRHEPGKLLKIDGDWAVRRFNGHPLTVELLDRSGQSLSAQGVDLRRRGGDSDRGNQ